METIRADEGGTEAAGGGGAAAGANNQVDSESDRLRNLLFPGRLTWRMKRKSREQRREESESEVPSSSNIPGAIRGAVLIGVTENDNNNEGNDDDDATTTDGGGGICPVRLVGRWFFRCGDLA